MAIRNAHAATLARLGGAILSGRHPPGSAIPPEPALCAELGVSRTIVREAIKSLVAKGLVTTGPKVGTRVNDVARWNWFDPDVVAWQSQAGMTREFLRDLIELRRIIEPAAVRLAAERASPAEIEQVERAYDGMKDAIEHGGDYVRHDLDFHRGLLRACRNRMLAQTGDALGALLRTAFEISTSRPHGPALSLPMHRALLDAVVARDGAAAERAAVELIDGARDDVEVVLRSNRRKIPSVAAPARPLAARRPRSPRAPRAPREPIEACGDAGAAAAAPRRRGTRV